MLNYTAGQKQLCDYKINTRLILLLALLDCMSSISNVIFIANTSRQTEGTLKSNTFLIQLLKSHDLALCSLVLFRH